MWWSKVEISENCTEVHVLSYFPPLLQVSIKTEQLDLFCRTVDQTVNVVGLVGVPNKLNTELSVVLRGCSAALPPLAAAAAFVCAAFLPSLPGCLWVSQRLPSGLSNKSEVVQTRAEDEPRGRDTAGVWSLYIVWTSFYGMLSGRCVFRGYRAAAAVTGTLLWEWSGASERYPASCC